MRRSWETSLKRIDSGTSPSGNCCRSVEMYCFNSCNEFYTIAMRNGLSLHEASIVAFVKNLLLNPSRMARSKVLGFLLLLFFHAVLLSIFVIQGFNADHSILVRREQLFQGNFKGEDRNSRRLMIGSTMPTCTYNECRGCRFGCRAEQVPVEGNDPVHSAYRYRCVCHRR
ncbi:hypothetical protein MLD38_012420 [Melastoma candidum]|uniref:Uncharacterized protein n=1 Tax=Melastoma candidum TaxID=119954 RepID=A0ACB9R7D1_9MYRT|nr:hypothetical protein MLD38_012420 [Melastoma candidum]